MVYDTNNQPRIICFYLIDINFFSKASLKMISQKREKTTLEDIKNIDFSCVLPSTIKFLSHKQSRTPNIEAKVLKQ